MKTLRKRLLDVLLESDADSKAEAALALDLDAPVSAQDGFEVPAGIPGRPPRPVLVPHTKLKPRSVQSLEGRAALLHALAHIEFNAINLAADVAWRFEGMQIGRAHV